MFVGVRLPKELLYQVDREAETKTRSNRSKVIRQALRAYFASQRTATGTETGTEAETVTETKQGG